MSFFSNLKPLPRFLLIAVSVGAVVTAVDFFYNRMPASKTTETVKPVEAVAVPAEGAAGTPVVAATVAQPAPVAASSNVSYGPAGLTPASTNSGLDAVLKAGQK